MKWIPLFILTTLLSLQAIAKEPTSGRSWLLKSPDQQITLSLILSDKSLSYSVNYKNKAVIKPSALGFAFKDQPQLQANLKALKVQNRSHNYSWQPVWGQRATIVDHYNEISLALTEQGANARQMQLVFRVYNDGVAFRYLLPKQPHLNKVVISDELTEFAFARNFSTWWIQAYQDQRFEYQYLNSALSSVNVAHTPLTLLDQSIAVSVHEAALVDYASMTLRNITDNHIRLKADLVPWANGDKVYTQTPFQTPWRTIQIADSEVALLNSDLILNLNEPAAKDTDVSYIKPGKYIGIWWEMHIGEKDWSPGPKQGATTERAMQYIDFASKHKIDAVLIEGWNKGWEGDWWQRPPPLILLKLYKVLILKK